MGGGRPGFLDPLGTAGDVHRAGMGRITPLWTLFAPPGQWVDELCP